MATISTAVEVAGLQTVNNNESTHDITYLGFQAPRVRVQGEVYQSKSGPQVSLSGDLFL